MLKNRASTKVSWFFVSFNGYFSLYSSLTVCFSDNKLHRERERESTNTNELLFATTLFLDLPEINWFTATNFHDQALYTPDFYYKFRANTS